MENATLIDSISKLPDDLLLHLLSLLPTKQAFSTTVLSKRWTRLGKLLTALYFHDESVHDEDAFFRFCSFVDTVMLSVELIKTFYLSCDSIYWRQRRRFNICGIVNNWIQTLNRHPLENLHLYSSIASFNPTITLPPTIFTFPTLVVLKLTKFHLDGDISVDLPLLKTLHLNEFYFKNHESFNKLLHGCPVLEDLSAFVFYMIPDQSFSVNGTITLPPTIFTFTKLVVLKLTKFCSNGDISVDFPLLKILNLNDVYFKNHENFNKLLNGCPILEDLIAHVFYMEPDARFTVNTGQSKTLSRLFRADIYDSCVPFTSIYNVQILKLRVNKRLTEEEINFNYRNFENLINLELFLNGIHHYLEDVMGLLQNFPKLQILSIAKLIDKGSYWEYPNSVPKCISSHLRSCTLKFDDILVDLRLARYILKNAPLLENMKITVFNVVVKRYAFKEIASWQRISPKCKISIMGQHF